MDILTQMISLLFRHRQTEIGRFGQDIDHIQRKPAACSAFDGTQDGMGTQI